MTPPRLYVATLDPRISGGVPSMAGLIYSIAQDAGYDPCLVCNTLDRTAEVRIRDILSFDFRREIEHTEYEKMELKAVPRILPEFEFLQYILNERGWRKAMKDGDLFVGVGGSNHCCIPLLRAGVPFASWTATPFWGDRQNRISG